MKKVELVIKGRKVVDQDYRPFLLLSALNLGIQKIHACNAVEKGSEVISVKLEGADDKLNEFINFIGSRFPEQAEVEEIEERCLEMDVMDAWLFMKFLELELWSSLAALASDDRQGCGHMVMRTKTDGCLPLRERAGQLCGDK
jgi:acylphosphatase